MSTWRGQGTWRYLVKHYFLNVSVSVFLEEISNGINGLSKVDGPPSMDGCHLLCWELEENKKEEEGKILFLCLTLELENQSSPAPDWNLYTDFPGFLAFTQQIMRSLTLCNCVSQFLIINLSLSLSLNLYIDTDIDIDIDNYVFFYI